MYNFSDIKDKKVIALYEAELLGEVKNIVTDKTLKRVRFFQVKSDDGDALYFPYSAIFSIGGGAVILKNKSKIFTRDDIPSPLSVAPFTSSVFTHEGEMEGSLCDLVLEGEKIESLTLDNGKQISALKILSLSEHVIIVNGGEEKVKLCPPVSPTAKKEDEPVQPTVTTDSVQDTVLSPIEPSVPQKAITSLENNKANGYAFLKGRTVTKDLALSDGTVIVYNGQTIDEQTLSMATTHDKLVQLALHSK